MRRVLLFEKIENIKAASHFEHKLIDSIWIIMQMKRKAENDYKVSLEGINQELQKYIGQDNGFLTDIIKAFQSYITVIYQNQSALIDGYDHEILSFLLQAKQSTMQQELISEVKNFDARITECQDKILNIKKNIKENEAELQVISHQVRLSERVGMLSEEERKALNESYKSFVTLKQLNEDKLEAEVDGMMELTMTHNHILRSLDQYQTIYLQKKGSDVFDNFMRVFVLEVSFIRSMQFDVGNILQKVKDKQQQHKKVALEALKLRMRKQTSAVAHFLRDTYKKLTDNFVLQIKQPFIHSRIKNKWTSVCDYYKDAI